MTVRVASPLVMCKVIGSYTSEHAGNGNPREVNLCTVRDNSVATYGWLDTIGAGILKSIG